jgi:universal stress protein E
MSQISKVFVVIDPTTDQQTALERAVHMVQQNKSLSLHIYCAVFSSATSGDLEALKRVEIARHRAWIEAMVTALEVDNADVAIEVEWTSQWRDALAPAADRCGANLIVKAAGSHWAAGRRLLKTSDWTLLRNAHCPVYMTKGKMLEPGANILVALDIKKEDDLHNTLNERVIGFGQSLGSNITDASLHAVNAYSSSERYVYPEDLAAKLDVPVKQAHTIEGQPAKVIAEVAERVKADLVIIGNASRQGAKAAVIGNTAEKVLDAVDANVLVVNAR